MILVVVSVVALALAAAQDTLREDDAFEQLHPRAATGQFAAKKEDKPAEKHAARKKRKKKLKPGLHRIKGHELEWAQRIYVAIRQGDMETYGRFIDITGLLPEDVTAWSAKAVRPKLKSLDGLLHVENADDPRVQEQLIALALVPSSILAQVRAAGVQVRLGLRDLSTYPEMAQYAGTKTHDGRTWEQSQAVFDIPSKTVIVNAAKAQPPDMLHEFGHAFDVLVSKLSDSPEMNALWLKYGPKQRKYLFDPTMPNESRREFTAEMLARSWSRLWRGIDPAVADFFSNKGYGPKRPRKMAEALTHVLPRQDDPSMDAITEAALGAANDVLEEGIIARVGSYVRRTPSGKTVRVKAHTRKGLAPAGKRAVVVGTSFHGHRVSATKAQLSKAFGPPQLTGKNFDDNKTTAEWHFTFDDKPVTLYDWKGSARDREWNVGARDADTARAAHAALVAKLGPARPKAAPRTAKPTRANSAKGLRSDAGRVRNFKAMSDEKLQALWMRRENFYGDNEAVEKLAAEVAQRRGRDRVTEAALVAAQDVLEEKWSDAARAAALAARRTKVGGGSFRKSTAFGTRYRTNRKAITRDRRTAGIPRSIAAVQDLRVGGPGSSARARRGSVKSSASPKQLNAAIADAKKHAPGYVRGLERELAKRKPESEEEAWKKIDRNHARATERRRKAEAEAHYGKRKAKRKAKRLKEGDAITEAAVAAAKETLGEGSFIPSGGRNDPPPGFQD